MKNDGLKRGLWMIGILMVAVIILQSLILWTNITGYTIVDFGNYSSEIGLNYTTNSSYIWEVPEEGILTSLKLSGYVAGDSASVYLGDDLVYMSSVAENSLVSVANGSGEIELNFSYGSNLGYDNNNDGVAFISDVIDFFVNASFDFNVSYDNLCTKYVVNNLDDNLTYPVCYGSLSCCDFLNLESLGNWSDSLLLNYGKYSSGYNNTVDATLIYYDVNLSVPYSNIYNSETLRLDANFVDAVEFELECEDTCLGLNYSNSSYSLDIVVDGLLHISNVSYSLGNESDDNSTNVTEDPFGDAGTLDYPDSSINVTCGDALDTAGTYYTLNESVSGYVGTCFNIIADDVVLDGNGFMIDGDDSGTDYGVNASGKDNITIKNFANVTDFSEAVYLDNTNNSLIENVTVKSNTGYGVHLKSSSDNTLTNNIANSNALWGINIDSNSNNNQLINNTANLNSWFGVTITSSSNNTILNLESYQNSLNEIDWTSGTGNKIIYNNSYGEIAFIDQIDYDLEGDLRFGPGYNIEIGNNSVYLNSTNLTSLNKSANITLNLADWSFTNPEIKKDGIACSDCYNFTSLSASTVVFNVSSWSNYSVGEVVDPFSLTDCGVLGSAGTYTLQNNLTGISGSCFNITAADVVLNGKGFVIDGDSTGEDYGVYTNGSNNLTIKNFGNIKDFIRGVYLIESNDSVIENNTMIYTYNLVSTYAIYLEDSNHTTVYDNIIDLNTGGTNGVPLNIRVKVSSGKIRGHNNITGNNLTANSASSFAYGIYLDNAGTSDYNTVQSNTLDLTSHNTEYGIYLYNSYGDSMDFNTIQSNDLRINATDSFAYGIKLENDGPSMDFNIVGSNTVDLTASSTALGISLSNFDTSNSNLFQSNDLRISSTSLRAYGITLEDFGTSQSHTLLNNNVTYYGNEISKAINDGSGTGDTNYLIYNNSFGEIRWTSSDFLTNLTVFENMTFGEHIIIGNNTVYLNSNYYVNDTSINSSANVTLQLSGWSFSNPEIKKDGVACSDCYNFTSLSASTVVFNVSSWSNYSVGERPNTAPNVTSVVLNTTDISLNDTNQNLTCYATGIDSEGDNLYYSGMWLKNGSEHVMVENVWNETIGGSDYDSMAGVVADSLGNVYAAGSTKSFGGSDTDVWIVKYDSDGNHIWNTTWGGTNTDNTRGMTIDSSDNIYVIGYSLSFGGGDRDFLVIKYNSEGVALWNRTMGAAASDDGNDVVTDSLGNVYATGDTMSFGAGNTDVWTIKMDSDGNHVWNKTIGGGNWEGGRGITIDASNNLYITGHTQSFGAGSDDVWTIKYDADGNVIWNRTLGGNESDYGYDITTDSAGQVYITGKTESFGSGSSNVWTIKYDTDGNHVWNTTFGGSANVGKGIISDSFDNIYIGGNGPGYDVLTIKYDSEGNQIWNITKGVDLYSCSGNGIAKDNYGNIYVAGSYAVAFNSYDGWTIKYQDGFTLSNQTQGEQVLVDTIDLSNTTTSDIWSCKIKVYDGSAESSVVSSANLTIMDTSPSCSDANPSGDLNCSGESITYTEDVVVNVSANYTDSNITAQKITITSNAVVVYDSVVLYVDDLIIEEGGYLEFRNGGQTVWHNGDWNISGTVLTNHETHRINVSIDGEFGINVLGGNFTIMNGTNITNGESATAEYYFNVLGNFSLENSFVSEMISNGINLRSGSSINELGNISFYDNLGFALSLGEDISLSGDLNVDGSCFNITADDVILDLNGYNITGSDNGAYRGIQAIGKDNITIMDGLIEWFGKSVFDGAGIFLEYVDNSVIENIIISNNAYSLNLFSDSNNNNLYNITTTLNNGPGIYLQGNVNNNNFYNVISISNNDDGISLSNGPNNNSFYNTTINLNSDDGLKLISSSNNTFNNLNSYSNGGLEVNYISGEGNKMIYNNSYGQMSFIDDLDYDIEGTLRIGPGYNIEIGNNSAYLNSSGDISELNKSANVSLELTGWSFSNPVIYRNSVEVCNSTTTPACHNFTSLSASTVVFNVTSWSNYSIGEAPFDPSLYFTFQINTSKASGTTFSFTADNYNNFDIIWGDGNSNTSLSGNGLIAHTYAGEGVYNVSVKGYTNRIMFFDQFFTGKQNMLVDILTNVSNGVSGINSTYRMFEYTSNFGKTPLTEPAFFDDVSGDVTYMAQMFMTSQFNQSISNWNVSSVTDMGSMFWVSQFNQPIPDWDVSSVTDMNGMFAESQFNQDIGSWNVSSVTDMEGMFSNAQLSVTNYDSLLTGWASLSPALSDSEAFDAGSSQYCTGLAGKIILNTTHSWTITDGGKNCTGITDLIECGIIDSSGTYTVQNDINATDVCFNITSDNVILNGAGFTIDGDSTGTDYGVYTNGYNNLTIKNFGNIKEFIRGIYLIESNDSVIENNTMVSTYADTTYAIYLVDSNHTTVYDNVIEWNTTAIDKISYGVYIYQTVARGYNNITENNLTIHSLKYAYGIYQVNYGPSNFNTIQSNRLVVISLYAYGLYLSNEDTSNFNTIQSNTMNVNGTLAYGVYLNSQGISSNTLLNNNLSCSADILHRVIEDRSGAGDTNYLVYNNNFGEIRWTASVFLTNLDVVENITFGEQIIIGNNTAYLNSDYYVSDKSINSSANITLYNMNLFSFTNPAILKDNVLCSDCYNFTALNASTVVFNVSSWSNYSIGETPNTAPNVTSVVLNTTDVSTNDTTQNLTCYATGTDTDSDNLTYYGKWKNGSNYYSDLNHLDNDDQGGYAYGVWGDGNFIYLANHDNGIEVYSVNTTGGLTHIDHDDQGGYALGVWGDENFIYLANYDNGIEVYSNEGSFRLSNQTQGEEVLVGTLGSSITTASENWSCSVKAYDGVDYSSYLSSGNVTILDIDAPVFTNLANQSILNNETLIYDIDATDVSGIDTFTVNDSNFVINSTGYLTNATVLTIGTYYLNISVNDTIGNVNSGVINVEVNESNTAPNITSVVLNTTDILTNDTTQNLTGYVVASDVDSDNITYAYNWYKNGTLNATSLITDGLVSYWPLDNDVEDYWGGNDGTNSGATLASGKVNGSYSFDGSDNNIFIEDTIGLNSTEVTASIWIKSIGDTTNRRFLTFGSTLQSRYVMGIQSGEIRTYDDILNEGQTDIVYSSFENNRWYYYVTVFNSNGSKYIYLDGEWIYTDENGGSLKNLSATKTWIGSQIDDNYWNGSIDEVLIYNRSLTAAEIKQIYDGSKAGGHTMNSSQTSIGDNWTLGVRGLDYSSIGDEVNSSSVLILNSVPLVSQVILNTTSSTNDTTQNLTGYVVANDFDSDNITYAYNWYKNGTLNATSLITDGLVAYYPLNNDTLDYYGDNVGVCTNCPTKNINSYAIGGAYSFDGVNDKLVYNSANLDSSEGITISIWIKAKNYSLPSVNSCDSGIIASRDANVFFNGGWSISTCIYNNARKAVIWFSNSSNTTQLVMSSQTEVMDDKWHYLVGTFISSGNISLYVDGQMENTSIAAPYGEYNTSSIYISTKQNGNGSYFNGSIDEVMIFNRTLNKSEIQQLYWAGVAKGHTMNSSQTTVGDSWKLGVRGLDDQNIGDEVNSSSVLILNSVPLVSQVILNTTSSTNDTTQNLTGYVIALDVDFDNVTYAYNWYKNGTLNATSLITDGLVGYWPLDNDVMDYWGSNDGINNGTTRNVAGKVGGTYELNGSNYIDCGNDSSLNIPREITVSFWAKPFSLGPWETMIGKNLYNAPTDLGSYIFKLDGSLNVYLFVNLEGGSNIGIQASNYVPFIDEWNYFAFTFNGSTANIYMNGTLIGTQSVPTNLINITNNVPLTFGVGKDHEGNLEQYFFNGSIDEVMVFNRSLTSTEIQRVYVGGITGGNILNPSQTTVGDSWKLGVRGLDYSSIGDEVNSSSIEILNYCGNNIKEGNETCDGDDHGGLDCSYFGSYTGTPTCDSSCSLTQTGCTATGGGGDSCTDSCTSSESPQCSGSYGYQTCGNYDNDNCLEWGSTQDCGTTSCSAAHTTGSCDNTCSEGSCGSCTPSSCSCESGWNDCNDDMGDGCETSGACEECSSDSDCDAGYGCQGGSCVECTCENQGDYCKDDTYPDSCNNADACTGTKLDTVWSPDTSTECIGTPFTQRGLDCAQTKESSGTLDPDCDGRVCGDAPNGCGTCSTGCSGNLLCNSEGQCEEPPACTGDGDCDNYDKDYCSGSVWMHKEGVCSDQNECGIGTESIVQDCSSELYYFQDPNIYLTEGICTELTLTEAKCDTTTKVAHYCEDNNVCTNNDYSEDPWSCTNSPNDAAIYGTKTKTCASGILSCTQTCSGGSMVDCTLDDCCDGVICEELTETCDDGSTRSCSPSCSGDGSCGSCTISCPEGEKEVAEQYADDSDKSKFACMNVTRSVEANQLSTKTIEFDERLVPKGYSIVMDPFNMGCNGEDVEFTVAIPDTFVDVQILKCKGDDCSAKETKTVTELWCEGEFVESVKEETRLLSPNLIPVKITPKKVDISELKQSIESGDNKIKFSEGFEGAVTLSMPSTVIEEAQNPYLKIIGSPVVLEFESSVKEGIETDLTVPYLITEKYDEDSLAIYGKLESGWKFIESSVDKQNGLVYSNVENIAEFIINNQATFALMGILRSTEFESKLERAYYPEQDTKDLIILVHGTASSPKTFQGIIDDISFSDQNIALYTLRYSLANSIDEIANEFSNLLETRTQEFDNIHIIAHSAGGIITQQALRESYDNSAEFIEKIGKVILVATPNEGSPIAEVYKNLFNELINEESDNPVFSINSQSIDDLIKGRIIPRVPDIDYYVIAGTREFSIKIPFFDDTSDLFEGETSDGVVTTESASHIGDSYIANKCENYWEIHLTHNDLIGDPLARKVIENIIAKEILKTESLLGKSNYYELDIENCDSAETYVVIGKEILLEEVEDVSFCNCGNGVCGVGEDAFNCPEDCAFFLSDIKDKGTLLILGYVVLILIMLILSIKAIKYVYIIHYLEKKSSKVKEKIKFNDYIKSVEICINKHEIVQGFKILNRVQKRLLVLKHFVSKKEFKQYKSKFKILSDSIKHLKNTNKNLFYDQLEAETKRIRQSKKRVCITVEKKGAKGYLNKRLCNTKEVLSLEKIKLFFELPHLELFFRFKPASKNHIERNIKFLFGKIKRYEDHITYRPKRNAYLVKMFVMYSKVYSKLISSKIDTKEKENLSKKLKIIHRNLKRLQREKPKPLLKERLKKLKPLDVEIKHISAEDLRKRVQKITSKIKKYEIDLIEEKKVSKNYSLKLFKEYVRIYSNISMSDVIKKDILIKPLKKVYRKIRSIQTTRLDEKVPPVPKSLKKYNLDPKRQRKDLIKRYDVLKKKINKRLKSGEQFKLFMEYSRLYSDLAHSSIEGDERIRFYDKLEKLNKKLKRFGDNGKD